MDKALLMAEHRALFHDNKFRSTGKEYYEWKIYKNPIAEGDIYLEIKDGRVVGSSTLMPRKVGVLNQEFSAAEIADSFTLPEYRRQGINSKVLKSSVDYAISHGMKIIYGTPNQAAYGLEIKLGFLPCSHISYSIMTKSLKPIIFTIKLVTKIFLFRKVAKNYQYLKYLLKKMLRENKDPRSGNNSHEKNYYIKMINKFSDNVDGLWGKPRYAFFVLRDSRYLNWRYFENPDQYTVLAALKDQEYLGYIVLKMSKDNKTGIICDFVTLNDKSDVFFALVKESEKILKQKGTKLVQLACIVDSLYYETLNELGYYDHGEESYQPIIVYSKTELGKRVIDNIGRWHFTLGDSDQV